MKQNKKLIKALTIFLSIALVLTFFSKTIYNFNLPTVTTVKPAGGKLVDKIEKTARITYANVNNLYAATNAKIMDITVEVGQEVQKGDIIMRFYQDEDAVTDLKMDIEKKNQDIEMLRLHIANLKSKSSSSKNKGAELDESEKYQRDIERAQDNLNGMEMLYEEGMISRVEYNEAQDKLDDLKLQYKMYLETGQSEKKDTESQLELEMKDLQLQMEYAKLELNTLKKELKQAEDAVLIADADGRISGIYKKNSELVSSSELLVQMTNSMDDYSLEITLDEKELDFISQDSKIEIKAKGINQTLTGKIVSSSIMNDETTTKQRLVIAVEHELGDLANRNADVIITTESQIYDAIVPNGAIRSDDKGYYVLTLTEDDSVFGKNYLAKRVSVDVLDSDSTLSAISGLTFFVPIIESSTKSIDHGSRVKYEEK